MSTIEHKVQEYEKSLVIQSEYLIDVYRYSETPLLCLGVVGHCLSLLTLYQSTNMQTPSFLYHKLLTASELLYIFNCFVQKFLDLAYSVENLDQGYNDYTAALYLAIVNRIIGSVTGYIILYMTLLIAFDRLLALNCHRCYRACMNKRFFATVTIIITIMISAIVNSWASAFENVVQQICEFTLEEQNLTEDSLSVQISLEEQTQPLGECKLVDDTVQFYKIEARSEPEFFLKINTIKNLYNSVIRIAYPILLTVMTIAVIYGFIRQRQRRRSRLILSGMADKNTSLSAKLLRSSREDFRSHVISEAALLRDRCQERKENNLFYLLLFVVILTYVQVLPREFRRILELLYPYAMLRRSIDNFENSISIDERFRLLRIVYYGHIWSKILGNLCTFVNRSLNFYLYFLFNSAFRTEVLKILESLSSRIRKHAASSNIFNRPTITAQHTAGDNV